MRIGPDLARWLDDPSAQAASQARSLAALAAIRAQPALRTLSRALARLPDDPGGERADAAVRPLFEDLGWLRALVRDLANALADDPFALPVFPPILSGLHDGLLLHDCPHLALAVGSGGLGPLAAHKARGRGGAVTFTGRRQRLLFLKAGGVRLGLYRLVEGRARRIPPLGLADGMALEIDGRDTAWTIEHAAGDLLLLQATIKSGAAPLALECDAATGAVVGRATTDEDASRMQLLASMLGAMGRRDAAPALAACLDHPAPFLRWHAMRELAALDPAAAVPLLTRLERDADAGVRQAAAATRTMLCPA